MIRLLTVFFLFLLPYTSTAWDASVSVTNGIHLVKENDSSLVLVQKLELDGAYHESTRPLVHDPKREFLYISGAIQKNATFFYRINLKTKLQDRIVITDTNGKMEGKILGLEHDYVKNTLYWSNGHGGKILKLDLNSNYYEQVILHDSDMSNLITSGIALDECSRTIFWTSYKVRDGIGYIESSKLDGSNRRILHNESLHNPTDVTVDHSTKKLYWCDMKAGSSYSIERSNLDGSFRELIIEGNGVQPISIALTSKYVYWINIESEKFERTEKDSRSYRQDKILDYEPEKPRSIVSRKEPMECSRVREEYNFKPYIPGIAKEGTELNFSRSVYTTDIHSKKCLNGGYREKHNSQMSDMKCKCPSGFHGELCEKCAYCVNGRCSAGKDDSLSCICDKGFSGLQCERNVCYNYCLNGGQCTVGNHSEPICNCTNTPGRGNYHGPRCEINCDLFCQNNPMFIIVDSGKTVCSCGRNGLYLASMDNATASQLADINHQSLMEKYLTWGLIGTSVLCVILMFIIIYCTLTIVKLRKRPRIKKRIIVNKNITPTPLTSRPSPIEEQCEITIENCCNMNICETPCYEPQLRTSNKSVSKTEEKKNLLRNMEEGEIGSASQDTLY